MLKGEEASWAELCERMTWSGTVGEGRLPNGPSSCGPGESPKRLQQVSDRPTMAVEEKGGIRWGWRTFFEAPAHAGHPQGWG